MEMKIIKMIKFSGLMALALSVAVGCASAPTETQEPTEVSADAKAEAQAAIDEAKAAARRAGEMGAEWRDTAKIIRSAEEALAAGDTAKAIELANKARRQAENAIAQHESEMERLGGHGAMGGDSYTVMRGDNLWNISGKSEIYGNPYQWPLIYKANQNQIQDADLIYPGQNLAIDRAASAADIDAAVNHAKTRGAWSIGVTEESDKAYLAR
jgi:nucleoid-associated protein YgaU